MADNVVEFEPLRLTPHVRGDARCIGCGHEWVAVAPYDTRLDWLECPNCRGFKGRYFDAWSPGPGNTGEGFQLICRCGNYLYHILADYRVLCANCGLESEHMDATD